MALDLHMPWHHLAHFFLCQMLPFQISPVPIPPDGDV